MYSLEIDLELYFVPPMEDFGNGISVTRTLNLPFVPHSGLLVFGQELDDCPTPGGFPLAGVTWDVDRQVFLAKSKLTVHDWPIVAIPDEVRAWVERGWRLGSFMEHYEDEDGRPEQEDGPEVVASDLTTFVVGDEDWPELLKLQATPHRGRPREFNILFQVVLRTMAELHNNPAVAYAMYKTQRFFAEREYRDSDEPAEVRQFRNAQRDFEGIEIEEQVAWLRKVKRKYPSLRSVVR